VHFSCGLGWSLARRPFYNHINSVKAQKELKTFTSSPLHLMLSWSTRWLSRKKKHHNQYVNVTSTGMIGSGSIWKVGGPEKSRFTQTISEANHDFVGGICTPVLTGCEYGLLFIIMQRLKSVGVIRIMNRRHIPNHRALCYFQCWLKLGQRNGCRNVTSNV